MDPGGQQREPNRRRRRPVRWLASVAALALALSLAAPLPAGPAGAQDALPVPTSVVPQLPSEVAEVTKAVSPVVWQACRGTGLAVGAVVVAGTLLGVPSTVTEPLNAVIAATTGPVLGLFFELCQQVPLPDDPPTCAVDEQFPPLPSLGRPVLPAALLAAELRALDATLSSFGVPFDGALQRAADDLLECAAGEDPEPEPESEPEVGPAVAPSTAGDDAVAPPSTGGSSLGFPGGAPSASPAGGPLRSPSPPGGGAVTDPLLTPTGTTGDHGDAGRMRFLLAIGALAAGAWVHAGRARRPRPVATGGVG